jgi:ubiquinone/menaquinone biosynthesis C-methylase UbiE
MLSRIWHWFIRTFFRLLYGPFALTYDAVAHLVSFGEWKAWGRITLDYLSDPLALELGHGPGHLQLAMAQRGLTPVGLDLSPQMGTIARRRLAKDGYRPRLVRARAQALPFADGTFPQIVATFPTEYIIHPLTIEEIKRVLPPCGKIVVVAATTITGKSLPARFLEWLYRITGQRAPELPQARQTWIDTGLKLEVETVSTPKAQVLVIVGQPEPP